MLNVLTIQEDWCRQGVERYTADFELWYGQYQHLPYVEDVEVQAIAGSSVALGSEVIANGYFGIRVGGTGSYTPIYADTVIHLGPMFTNSKKLIGFKLLVPEGAETTKYMHLELQFTPKMARFWGRFQWGVGIYGSGVDLYDFHPDVIIYRAYIFDRTTWSELVSAGVISSPFDRGYDHQW